MIRAMTDEEIVKALRRSAEVCIEKNRSDWWTTDVCLADATYLAASRYTSVVEDFDTPEDAATFLLLVAEAVC